MIAALAGCASVQPPPGGGVSESPALPIFELRPAGVDSLLRYAVALRKMTPAELQREHDAVRQALAKNRDDQSRAQLALIYALPGSALRDPAAANGLLDGLTRDASAPAIKNFAAVLQAFIADGRRQDETAQALAARLRDEQKQSADLQQKLEALKSIERSISNRERANSSLRP